MLKSGNDEKTALTMSEKTQYHRVSNESDEEFDDIKLHSYSNVSHLKVMHGKRPLHKDAIKWNCECISRLLACYVLLMIAFGFIIHSMPPVYHVS